MIRDYGAVSLLVCGRASVGVSHAPCSQVPNLACIFLSESVVRLARVLLTFLIFWIFGHSFCIHNVVFRRELLGEIPVG